MPCYRPLKAWRSKHANASGKRSLVFKRQDGFEDLEVEVPCGQCIGCKLERSRQWAIRCVHEASLYEDNCFITLTYNDENLPKDGSLKPKHFQDFMKRLRKKFPDHKIRYFHCGEYGDEGGRPHYHAIIFNFDFPDKRLYKVANQQRLYTSETLESLWPFGFCPIGSVTFESAAYVSRYITKKVTGEFADEHYQGKQPEYVTMSRRPGIGKDWFEKYKDDITGNDFVVINGKRVGVPKFYDNQLDEKELTRIKARRKFEAYKHEENNTLRRLKDRETVQERRTQLLRRSFENEA